MLARRGARPVGLDLSRPLLRRARHRPRNGAVVEPVRAVVGKAPVGPGQVGVPERGARVARRAGRGEEALPAVDREIHLQQPDSVVAAEDLLDQRHGHVAVVALDQIRVEVADLLLGDRAGVRADPLAARSRHRNPLPGCAAVGELLDPGVRLDRGHRLAASRSRQGDHQPG